MAITDHHLGHSNLGPNGAFEEEEAEMPWVGCVSTAPDMMRFAEMLRLGGTLDGRRIVSRSMVDAARTIWTGDKPNEFYASLIRANNGIVLPGNLGLGFSIRGPGMGTSMFGTLASAGTFGAHGAGINPWLRAEKNENTTEQVPAALRNHEDTCDSQTEARHFNPGRHAV